MGLNRSVSKKPFTLMENPGGVVCCDRALVVAFLEQVSLHDKGGNICTGV